MANVPLRGCIRPSSAPPGPWTGAPLLLGRRSSEWALLDRSCTLCLRVGAVEVEVVLVEAVWWRRSGVAVLLGDSGVGRSGVGCSNGEGSGASYMGHAPVKAPLLEASK
jgi:hypothetical protein